MNIDRRITNQVKISLSHGKSILLIGPRQTGKSTFCKGLKADLSFNLADQALFLEFIKDPNYLKNVIKYKKLVQGIILVDEVQRVPTLLNTIQSIIDENKKIKFILTGSSVRKLKREKANLLPGRIHSYEMTAFTSSEVLKSKISIQDKEWLVYGSLPEVVTTKESLLKKKLLKSYAQVYLNEEIKAEALTKNIEGFSRFLYELAADSSKYLDLNKISKKIGVPRQTVQRFFEILEDTLIVKRLNSFAKSDKRRIIQHPKFFIFDNGVLNSLLANFNPSADRLGFLFENLVFNQISAVLSQNDLDYRFSSYRTQNGAEVDFILELNNEILAIEVKSNAHDNLNKAGFDSFESFVEKKIKKIVVTMDPVGRKIQDIMVMHWTDLIGLIEKSI